MTDYQQGSKDTNERHTIVSLSPYYSPIYYQPMFIRIITLVLLLLLLTHVVCVKIAWVVRAPDVLEK